MQACVKHTIYISFVLTVGLSYSGTQPTLILVFSERELTFTFAICYIARPSVVCLSSVTFVRPTQAVEIFGNISTALGTLAIH